MPKIFIIILFCILTFTGCTTITRALTEAKNSIAELEQLNEERAERNLELESLYNSERTGNQELERIIDNQQSELDGYIESEKNRIEAEKRIIDSLSGIFGEGSEIIEELIRGYFDIRKIILQDEEIK